MLTDDELARIHSLLDSEATPIPIQQFLRYLLKCVDDLAHTQQRVQYLLTLAERIMYTPAGQLDTVAYMPQLCPAVPKLVPVPEISNTPADVQATAYKLAQEAGMQLLTPMEAEAFLQGMNAALLGEKDKLLGVILTVKVGQQIREQQHTE